MKTFLLGVGCQKGGTTWLHQYLHGHPACDFGFRKEYHVFDSLWIKKAKTKKFYIDALEKVVELAEESLSEDVGTKVGGTKAGKGSKSGGPKSGKPPQNAKHKAQLKRALQHLSFYKDPKAYAAYFDALHDKSPGVQLVGDITPSYNGLTAEQFRKIRNLLEPRGFQIKVVFLMRDPIERIYSASRMRIRDQSDKPEKQGKEPVTFFNKRYAWRDVEMRTRYERTMAALDTAFAPEDVHYGFYETLFTETEVRKITDFLGLDYQDPNFDAQVNVSPRLAELDAASIATVRRYYDATYRDCMTRFGEGFIKDIWPHAGVDIDTAPVSD